MSFSKGVKLGERVTDLDKNVWDYSRGEHEICYCSYPSCHNKKIERFQDAVFWDGVDIPKDRFEFNLSPMAKLATVANPKTDDKGREYQGYYFNIAMHAGCAAEWGMHLIKDGLNSHNVGTKLRQEKPNAIRKQT